MDGHCVAVYVWKTADQRGPIPGMVKLVNEISGIYHDLDYWIAPKVVSCILPIKQA